MTRGLLLAAALVTFSGGPLSAATLAVDGERLLVDGRPAKLWGVRTASASQTDSATAHLIAQLDDYLRHGINAVTVFYQGSSGGYSNPFSADGSAIAPDHQARLDRIIRACDARGVVVIVGIFYQRSDYLRTPAAWENATRTVVRALRPHRNVILNLANEQNSSQYRDSNPVFDIGDPAALLRLCDLVHREDPSRLVGAGGYDHEKNIVLGRAPAVDVLLFDTNGPEDSGALYERFVAAGVRKPVVNVEQFGAYSTKPEFPKSPGVFTAANRRLYLHEIEAARRHAGLHTFFFDARWLQGTGYGQPGNRYDLGGDGTERAPGWRWYAEAVRAASGR